MTKSARSTTSPASATPARSSSSKELGGVNAVKQASLEELQALSWLPDAVAEAVYAKFHQPPYPSHHVVVCAQQS